MMTSTIELSDNVHLINYDIPGGFVHVLAKPTATPKQYSWCAYADDSRYGVVDPGKILDETERNKINAQFMSGLSVLTGKPPSCHTNGSAAPRLRTFCTDNFDSAVHLISTVVHNTFDIQEKVSPSGAGVVVSGTRDSRPSCRLLSYKRWSALNQEERRSKLAESEGVLLLTQANDDLLQTKLHASFHPIYRSLCFARDHLSDDASSLAAPSQGHFLFVAPTTGSSCPQMVAIEMHDSQHHTQLDWINEQDSVFCSYDANSGIMGLKKTEQSQRSTRTSSKFGRSVEPKSIESKSIEVLVGCHDIAVENHWLPLREETAKLMPNTWAIYHTMDIQHPETPDLFDEKNWYITKNREFYDVIYLPDCGGLWAKKQSECIHNNCTPDEMCSALIDVLQPPLMMLKPGGFLYVGKFVGNRKEDQLTKADQLKTKLSELDCVEKAYTTFIQPVCDGTCPTTEKRKFVVIQKKAESKSEDAPHQTGMNLGHNNTEQH